MNRSSSKNRIFLNIILFVLFLVFTLFSTTGNAYSQERQINGGPYSLTMRGGAQGDSGGIGLDLRADYLNPVMNVHLFGTYDLLDASSPLGQVNSQRYGAGFALSHTYPRKANVFVGTSFINELDEYFGHAYVGGKVMVSDSAFITGSYGVGISKENKITKPLSKFTTAEAANWGKLGVTMVASSGLKTNLSYYLTDPGPDGLNISGVEGEVSYPMTDALSLGVNGGADLTTKDNVDRNWRSFLLLTYSFGGHMGSPIDVALDKNSPAIYPVIIRRTAPAAASALAISPAATINSGCSAPASVFTASGGTAPYTWSSNAPLALTVLNATQARWWDTSDSYCGGAHTVTVTDSLGATATATIN